MAPQGGLVDNLLKVAALIVIGLLLLFANLWYFQLVAERFQGQRLRTVIAPVKVIGQEDPQDKRGTALAYLLQARMSRLGEEIADMAGQLDAAATPDLGQWTPTAEVSRIRAFSLPDRILEPLDLKMTVGGVELGPVLSWFQRMTTEDRVLRLVVHFEADNKTAIVGGALTVSGDRGLWLPSEMPDGRIVDDVAYTIIQDVFDDRFPEAGALKLAEFKRLLTTLRAAAELNRLVANGRPPATSEYASLLPALEELVQQTPKWRALIHLGAEIAENGGSPEKALAFYQKEVELVVAARGSPALLEERIRSLNREIVAKTAPADSARVKETPETEAEKSVLDTLGVGSLDMHRSPRVGVVGGVPAGAFPGAGRFEVLGGGGSAKPDPALGEYVTTIVSAVDMVAPKCYYLFSATPRMITGDADVLAGIRQLGAATPAPDVILVPLRLLDPSLYEETLQDVLKRGIPVVFSAGNEGPDSPAPFAQSGLADRLIVVGALEPNRRVAAFSRRGPHLFWAPGVDVPVRLPDDRTQIRAGTGYSAALAAGVVARVLDRHPGLPVERLVKALAEGSAPPVPPGQPVAQDAGRGALNLHGALEKLGASPAAAPGASGK